MSAQAQASSSPLGDPPSAMSTDSVSISDEETVIPDSSQMELVDLPAKTHNLRQNKDNRLDYKECSNSDSETSDTTDEASAESEYNPPPSTVSGVKTRSRAKKETQSLERTTQSFERTTQSFERTTQSFERTTQSSANRPNVTKRSNETYQSENTRPSKRGRPTATDITIKKFTTQACAWMETFASNARELENTRSENQELKRQIKRLDSALKQEQEYRLQEETAQSEDIHRLELKCKDLTRKLLSALEEAKKDSGKYVKVSDSYIQGRWQRITYNIGDMVTQYLNEYPIEQGGILWDLLAELKTPLPQSDDQIMMLRSHILRRTIWHFLMIGIFEGKFSIWHGDSGRTLTQFLAVQNEGHLDDTQHLKMISQIKSTAVAELGDEIQLNEEAIDELTSTVTMAVQKFIGNLTKDSTPDPTKQFQAMFKGLVKEAACLHTIMMKSKAIFLLQWIGETHSSTGDDYDPNNMDARQIGLSADSSLFAVRFVEAPALVKIGNADGEHFHLSMTLCKSSVVLEERDTHWPLRTTHYISDSEDGGENRKESGSLPPIKEESEDD